MLMNMTMLVSMVIVLSSGMTSSMVMIMTCSMALSIVVLWALGTSMKVGGVLVASVVMRHVLWIITVTSGATGISMTIHWHTVVSMVMVTTCVVLITVVMIITWAVVVFTVMVTRHVISLVMMVEVLIGR